VRALLAALLLLCVAPAAASAHAQLRGTVPERGEALKAAPAQIELRFSEPVEAEFGAVRVYDAKGRQVQDGKAFHPGGKGPVVAVRLRPGLPEGGYTVTYRVISADSHPVSSGFVFSIGQGGVSGAASVEDLLEGTSAGEVTTTSLAVARAVQYAAIAIGAGGAIFLLLVWQGASAAFDRRMRFLLRAAAAVGLASALAGIVLQGAVASGTSFWSALDPSVVGDVLGTKFGLTWGIGAVAWLLVPALAGSVRAAALPLLVVCAIPGLGGHAGVQSPRGLLVPMNLVHVLAMAAWLGGIAVLVLALRHATQELEGEARGRLLFTTVSRFSSLATVAVAAILLTGIGQSIVYMERFGQLLDTAFGRAVLIKAVLFVVILGLGYLNRSRLLPRLPESGLTLRRVLRVELLTGLLVIAVTGALASYAPSSAVSAGPFSTSTAIGDARMEVTVDPASVGPNEMHVYLFDRRSGAQYEAVKELTVSASLPEKQIDDLELQATKSGPGHYTITGASFGVAGDWTVQVGARVSDFDLYTARFELPIE
jgi:copper transport protein